MTQQNLQRQEAVLERIEGVTFKTVETHNKKVNHKCGGHHDEGKETKTHHESQKGHEDQKNIKSEDQERVLILEADDILGKYRIPIENNKNDYDI